MAGFFVVVVVTLPGIEGGILQGAGEGKGDGPRERTVFDDFSKIVGSLLGSLATGKKDYASEVCRDMGF